MAQPKSRTISLGLTEIETMFPQFVIKLAVKIFRNVIVDLREYKVYRKAGAEYPTKNGLFLYPSQFRALMELDEEGFFAPSDAQIFLMESPPRDLGYNATVKSDLNGGLILNVPKKNEEGCKEMRIFPSQMDAIRASKAQIFEDLASHIEWQRTLEAITENGGESMGKMGNMVNLTAVNPKPEVEKATTGHSESGKGVFKRPYEVNETEKEAKRFVRAFVSEIGGSNGKEN